MIKSSSYHTDWQVARMEFILSKFPVNFFEGKRILELGAFNGYIGARFAEMGAIVHCVDGRHENVERIKSDYPNVTAECADLDTPYWGWGKWDIIINFGLYYHLENYHKEHLVNCIQNCSLMFFESVIYDSDAPELFVRHEVGDDQSLSDYGGTPSTSYVENILSEYPTMYTKFSNIELNAYEHHYDWVDSNSKVFNQYARRFWIIHVLIFKI